MFMSGVGSFSASKAKLPTNAWTLGHGVGAVHKDLSCVSRTRDVYQPRLLICSELWQQLEKVPEVKTCKDFQAEITVEIA